MIGRSGVTLPELLLVSWLFALVLLATARFVTAQGALAAATYDRVRASDVIRTVDLVLAGELRNLAKPDLRVATDSIRLRAVRGLGVACRGAGSELVVRYHGVRRPDPAKDSALVVTGTATDGAAHRVTGAVTDDRCGGGYRLTLDPPPAATIGLVLVFETGAYHLADGALRYRRGRGGRQPVTEGVLAAGQFTPAQGRLGVDMSLHGDSLPRAVPQLLTTTVRLQNLGGATP